MQTVFEYIQEKIDTEQMWDFGGYFPGQTAMRVLGEGAACVVGHACEYYALRAGDSDAGVWFSLVHYKFSQGEADIGFVYKANDEGDFDGALDLFRAGFEVDDFERRFLPVKGDQ